MKKVLGSDRLLTITLISEETGLSVGIVHTIVTKDIAMRKVCAKLVPKVLSMEQTLSWVEIMQEILDCVQEDEDFLDNVITGDELWVFQYNPETKYQSSEGHMQGSLCPKKSTDVKIQSETPAGCFFVRRGIVHKEFVPTGTTINAAINVQALTRLRNRVTRMRPAIAKNWKLRDSCWQNSAWQHCLTPPPTAQTWLHLTFSCFRE